jgi:hypothetical protein
MFGKLRFKYIVLFMRQCVKKYGTARHATDDNILRRMLFACWVAKATDKHSEYVILFVFSLQRWLRERA